jgi:hypothetical protein
LNSATTKVSDFSPAVISTVANCPLIYCEAETRACIQKGKATIP